MKVGDLVKYYNTLDFDTQLIGIIVGSEPWAGKTNKHDIEGRVHKSSE